MHEAGFIFDFSFQTQLSTDDLELMNMDIRNPFSYKPQRQRRHHQKLELRRGRERDENRGRGFGNLQPGNAGFVDLRGRARQKNERAEVNPFFSSPSSPSAKFMKSPSKDLRLPSFEVDEVKLGAARRRLFDTGPGNNQEQDWIKGLRNNLKRKMNGKIRELRDSLEPMPKKALRQMKPPFLCLLDTEEDLKKKGLYFRRRTQNIFSSPSKDLQPRDPWAVKLPHQTKPAPEEQPLVFKLPGEKAREPDWREMLGATQDKMVRVRQWREKIQPAAPANFGVLPKAARAGERRQKERKEVIQPQPRTPPKKLRLRPELAVTQDKMARVREWRQNNQADPPRDVRHWERPNISAAINNFNQVDFRLKPELDVTQDKMVRVREWREKIQGEVGGEARARGGGRNDRDQKRNQNQVMPELVSTLHEMDWLNNNDDSNDNDQFLQFLNPWDALEAQPQFRGQRRKIEQDWGDYLESGNVCKFDEQNDDTFAYMKIFK